MTEKTSLFKRLWQKKRTKLFCACIVLGGVAWVSIPIGLTVYLEKWLVENGAESAHIEKIKLNPFTGVVALHGADIKRDGQVVFSDSTIQVNLGLQRLFSKEANVAALLEDVTLEVEQQQDGSLRIGSYTIVPKTEQEEPPAPEKDNSPWYLFAPEVKLKNSKVVYKQPNLKVEVVITDGKIERFNTIPEDKRGAIALKGTVNGTPFDFDLNQISVVDGLSLAGKVKLAGYPLQNFEQLLAPTLASFKGTAHLDGETSFTMDKDGNMEAQYAGTVGYEKGTLGGAGWSAGGTINWKGDLTYQSKKSDLQLVTNGLLTLDGPTLSLDDTTETMKVSGEMLSFDGTTKVARNQSTMIEYDGAVTMAGSMVNVIDSLTVQLGKLGWKGQGGYALQQDGQTITTQGKLTTSDLAVKTAEGIEVTNKTSAVQSGLSVTLGEKIQLKGTADVSLQELLVNQNDAPLVSVTDLAMHQAGGQDQGVAVQSVQVQGVTIPISETVPVQIAIQETILENLVSPDFANIAIGKLELNAPKVMDEQETVLAELAQVAIQAINASTNADVTVGQFKAEKGQFMLAKEQEKPLATLGAVNAQSLSWSTEKGFVADTITVDSVFSGFTREKGPETKKMEKKEKQPKPQQERVAQKLPVTINTITLVGKSGFTFIDNTLESPFTTELLLDKAQITDINLNNPEQPINYVIEGALDTYSPLKIKGSLVPLGKQLLVKQKAKLKNYSLQHLSPYVVNAIGTYFESGQLDLDSTLKIEGDALNIDTDVHLQDIKAETVNPELAAELNNSLPIPLDLALSMLRDKKGNIKLDIPVSGKLSDFSIGVTDIIVTSVGKAIAMGVAPYLAYTFLGPAGALVYLGGQVGQSLLETNLPPLTFSENQAELSEEQKLALDKIGPSIQKDAEAVYSICSKVAPAELGENAKGKSGNALLQDEEVRKQLFEIGKNRSTLVQQYLQNNFAITKEQLLICNPGINFEKSGATIIEFRK